jgi:Killer toxin-resistance protein 1
MQRGLLTPLLLTVCSFISLVIGQIAAGGGNTVAGTMVASQYPVVTNAPSLYTLNGVTSSTNIVFTQTFASTALGSWALGATPLAGVIGLGDIQGTIGLVNTKRNLPLETMAPVV